MCACVEREITSTTREHERVSNTFVCVCVERATSTHQQRGYLLFYLLENKKEIVTHLCVCVDRDNECKLVEMIHTVLPAAVGEPERESNIFVCVCRERDNEYNSVEMIRTVLPVGEQSEKALSLFGTGKYRKFYSRVFCLACSCIHTYVYVYIFTYMYMYVYIYICIYICIYNI